MSNNDQKMPSGQRYSAMEKLERLQMLIQEIQCDKVNDSKKKLDVHYPGYQSQSRISREEWIKGRREIQYKCHPACIECPLGRHKDMPKYHIFFSPTTGKRSYNCHYTLEISPGDVKEYVLRKLRHLASHAYTKSINLDNYVKVDDIGRYDVKMPPPPGTFLDTVSGTKVPQSMRLQKIDGKWNILGCERTDLTFIPLIDTCNINKYTKDLKVRNVFTVHGDSFESDVLMTAWGVYNEATGFLRTYRVHNKEGQITEYLFYLGNLKTRGHVDRYAHHLVKAYANRERVPQEAGIDMTVFSYSVECEMIQKYGYRAYFDLDPSRSKSGPILGRDAMCHLSSIFLAV
jgi:hypothetical protein